METGQVFLALGIAAGLGLLVGLQREKADSALAGVRTFPLITVFGTICAILAGPLGVWVVPAGLLGLAAATAMGNYLRPRGGEAPGITTEVAVLVMFAVGAMVWTGPREAAVALGAGCAVLLHAKEYLHGLVSRLGEKDMRAIMQFAMITLVILPVLPDRTFGPLGVLNPWQIWLMVVLVVSISLAGYVAYKVLPVRAAPVLGGLLSGLVSSTAATVSLSRRGRASPEAGRGAVLAIVLASSVVFVRVLTEIGVVAPRAFVQMGMPLAAMLGSAVVVSMVVFIGARRSHSEIVEPENPTELKSALMFGGLYALVVFAAAAARRWASDTGLYAVAALSGLTDMDAITLSTARSVAQEQLGVSTGWRALMLASMSNLLFKVGIVGVLGGRRVFVAGAAALGTMFAAGAAILLLWP